MHLLNETVLISIKISQKFTPNGLIKNIPALVQIMTWRRPGGKPLYEPMLATLLTHICVTRPQWVKNTVDKHTPEQSRVMVVWADAPWYTSELMKEKRLQRKLECKFDKTKSSVDKGRLRHQRNINNHLLTQAKQVYFETKILTAETSKDLYKVRDNLLNRFQKFVLPSHDCIKNLADDVS